MKNLLSGFSIEKYKKQKPPKDNSLTTFKEIKEIKNLKRDPKFVKDKDDQFNAFEKLTSPSGHENASSKLLSPSMVSRILGRPSTLSNNDER